MSNKLEKQHHRIFTSIDSTGEKSHHLWWKWIFVLVMGGLLVWGSQALLLIDTGDFARVIGHMRMLPVDGSNTRWTLPSDGFSWPNNPELASVLFTVLGWIQLLWPGAVFDLGRTAFLAKLLLLGSAVLLANYSTATLPAHATKHPASLWLWIVVFSLWTAALFMAHSIALAQSFYPEYALYIALPLLLVGFLTPKENKRRWAWIFLAALGCGLAKVQYFYVPTLVLLCITAAAWRQRAPQDKILIALLLLAQALCLFPMSLGRHAALNAHQSVYLGSYLMMTPDQLNALGVPAKRHSCIGIDGWGNQVSGPGGTQVREVGHTCYPETPPLGARDMLRPYFRFPQTLPKLMHFALPHHFTVNYFHVYDWFILRQQRDASANPITSLLITVSAWRERFLTPAAPVLLAWSLLFAAFSRLGLHRLALVGVFLSLFIVSQIIISLLGEGIRDLSKHLWGAQLALDMLTVITALQLFALVSCRFVTAQSPSGVEK